MTSLSIALSSHALRRLENRTFQHCLHTQSMCPMLGFQQQLENGAHMRALGLRTPFCVVYSPIPFQAYNRKEIGAGEATVSVPSCLLF